MAYKYRPKVVLAVRNAPASATANRKITGIGMPPALFISTTKAMMTIDGTMMRTSVELIVNVCNPCLRRARLRRMFDQAIAAMATAASTIPIRGSMKSRPRDRKKGSSTGIVEPLVNFKITAPCLQSAERYDERRDIEICDQRPL